MHDRQRTVRPALLLASVPALANIMLMAAPAFGQTSKKPVADSGGAVVATVNGEKITRAQIADDLIGQQMSKLNAKNPMFQDKNRVIAGIVGTLILKKMASNGGQPASVSRAEIVDFLFKDNPPIVYQTVQNTIIELAIQQEAKKQGVVVTPAELAAQMKKSIQNARLQYHMQGSDADVLAQIGVTAAYLRPHVTTQLRLEKLVRKELVKNPAGNNYVAASHILVSVQPDPANPMETEKRFAEAKTKIAQIAEEITSGKKTFEQEATQNNQDSTKFKGGSLGTFSRGQMVPEFDKAVFALPKGKLSEPVRTQFGWHLIRVDKTESEMTGPEKEQLQNQTIQSKANQKASELLKGAKVVNNIKPPSQPGGGMMPQ